MECPLFIPEQKALKHDKLFVGLLKLLSIIQGTFATIIYQILTLYIIYLSHNLLLKYFISIFYYKD